MSALLNKFTRKKIVDRHATNTQLHRVLTTLDLTLLGIGSTLGIGVYVLAGSVAKESAGPAVVLSFLVAAIASILAGLCYAEFGSRCPLAGSAYVYSYVCVGELIAFIVGWNLIMEYVIGVASVAKGYSGYVDQLFGHALSNAFYSYLPIQVNFLSDYFDAFAFSITLLVTIVLAFGVKESSFFNSVFTVLNLVVVLFVVIAGSVYASPKNWMLKKEDILSSSNFTADKIGEGGFAPFGFHGVMKGAATCFYGFVGFDIICTGAEEAKTPQRSIPLAIIFSLLFIFLAYFGISTVISMMVPYYLLDAEAPLPQAFTSVDFPFGMWVVTIGALFGLSTSLIGSLLPMPRVIYAMANDGVLFTFLSKVHPRFQTPLIATLLAGSFGAIMAAMFKLEALIDMMSIGTLTAYTLVAICVLCLRYRKDVDGADDNDNKIEAAESGNKYTFVDYLKQAINSQRLTLPSDLSSSYTNIAVVIYCFCTICFCATSIFGEQQLMEGDKRMLLALVICGLAMGFTLVSLALQPVSRVQIAFKVPFVPVVPGLSILANIYLIMKLSLITWIRFSVWMAIGFIIYAICLCNGTTDKCYKASVVEKQKRKYSKVSASGFDGNQLGFNQEKEGIKNVDDNVIVQRDGTYDKVIAENLIAATELKKNILADDTIDVEPDVETETIEKSLEFDDNETMLSDTNAEDFPSAEKAAVDAIDSVISEACDYAEKEGSSPKLNNTANHKTSEHTSASNN